MPTKRLFIAIAIPTEIRQLLSECKNYVNIPGLSWVKEENLHITLLFLGDTDVDKILLVEQKLSSITTVDTFTIRCKEVVPVTRRGKLSMIWAGFEKSEAFIRLATEVSQVLNHPPDHDPVPHVTLARVKKGLSIKLNHIDFPSINKYHWQVRKFGLWESVLSPQGSVYTVLQEWNLKPSQ